jgi:hypothetical protein
MSPKRNRPGSVQDPGRRLSSRGFARSDPAAYLCAGWMASSACSVERPLQAQPLIRSVGLHWTTSFRGKPAKPTPVIRPAARLSPAGRRPRLIARYTPVRPARAHARAEGVVGRRAGEGEAGSIGSASSQARTRCPLVCLVRGRGASGFGISTRPAYAGRNALGTSSRRCCRGRARSLTRSTGRTRHAGVPARHMRGSRSSCS